MKKKTLLLLIPVSVETSWWPWQQTQEHLKLPECRQTKDTGKKCGEAPEFIELHVWIQIASSIRGLFTNHNAAKRACRRLFQFHLNISAAALLDNENNPSPDFYLIKHLLLGAYGFHCITYRDIKEYRVLSCHLLFCSLCKVTCILPDK